MSNLHLVQVGFFRPILDTLHKHGANISKLLRASRLEHFRLEDYDDYVPLHCVYQLFNAIRRQEGIEDFIETFAETIKLVSVSHWGEMIAFSPDVLTALQKAKKYDGVVLTHEHAGFDIQKDTSTYWQYFDDKPTAGRAQAEILSITLGLNGFQLAAGKSWSPLELHLQSDSAPNLDRILPEGYSTKICLNQPRTAIVFLTAMLPLPMLGKDVQKDYSIELINKPLSLTKKVECILDSSKYYLIPGIEQISDMAGMSKRTFQRKLAMEKVSYFEVLDNWRFKKALNMLSNSNYELKQISAELGYRHLANFDRAFHRWTNSTPHSYREVSSM